MMKEADYRRACEIKAEIRRLRNLKAYINGIGNKRYPELRLSRNTKGNVYTESGTSVEVTDADKEAFAATCDERVVELEREFAALGGGA